MFGDLEVIFSDIYNDKPIADKEAWKTLMVKNDEYVHSSVAQQNLKRIRHIIRLWGPGL